MNYKDYVLKFLNENLIVRKLADSNLTLLEAVEIADKIDKAIKLIRPNFDKEKVELIKRVDVSDDKFNTLSIIDLNDKKVILKIGKVLKTLIPNITDGEMNNIIDYLRDVKKTPYTFKEHKNISSWYSKLHCDKKLYSCMVGKKHLTDTYENEPDISILICYENNIPVGRALLWRNVSGLNDKPYIDRTYPVTDPNIRNAYLDYAIEQGWNYRTSNDISNSKSVNGSNTKITFTFTKSISDIKNVPFMDTFRYGIKMGDDLVIANYKSGTESWDFQEDDRGNYRTLGTNLANDSIGFNYEDDEDTDDSDSSDWRDQYDNLIEIANTDSFYRHKIETSFGILYEILDVDGNRYDIEYPYYNFVDTEAIQNFVRVELREGVWGFYDDEFSHLVLTEKRYTYLDNFGEQAEDDYAKVGRDGKSGMIDYDLNEIISPDDGYSDVEFITDDNHIVSTLYFKVKKNGLYGVVTKKESDRVHEKIPPTPISDIIFKEIYTDATGYDNIIFDNGKNIIIYDMIDKEIRTTLQDCEIDHFKNDNHYSAKFLFTNRETRKKGLYLRGIVIQPEYDAIRYSRVFSGEIDLFKDRKWYVIKPNKYEVVENKIVLDPKDGFDEEAIKIRQDAYQKYIDDVYKDIEVVRQLRKEEGK